MILHYSRIVFCFFFFAYFSNALCCSRVLISDGHDIVLVGRTMDWSSEEMNTKIIVYPSGITRSGIDSPNAMTWQSKFGSVVATAYENYTTDGMNEKGLAAHILWLDESNYGKANRQNPSISVVLWSQFYLDNFATVAEAVTYTKQHLFKLIPFYHEKLKCWIKVHLALEDATGDSAIIEYIDGVPRIYHNPKFQVLTNSPTYDKQLLAAKTLKRHQPKIGDAALPGTTDSIDRFLRASFYSTRLDSFKSTRHGLTQLQSIINNVSQPYGKNTPERKGVSPTLWRTFADLSNQIYYFNFSTNLNMIWVPLKKMNLKPGSPILGYELLNDSNASGDISTKFISLQSL